MGQEYITDREQDDDEYERLKWLETLYDPPTQAALRDCGPLEGQKVLELGPGGGSMLRWLAAETGPKGQVIGVDQNPRFLAGLDLPNVSLITGNFYDVELTKASFDLVFARFVFLHLSDPAAALARMFDLLRPGGSVVIFDIDSAGNTACDPGHRSAKIFEQACSAICDGVRDAKLMEMGIGRRLPLLLADKGFERVAARYQSYPIQGGTKDARWWQRNFDIMGTAGLRTDTLPEDFRSKLKALDAIFDDPSFWFLAPLFATAQGRRPED